MTYDYVRSDSAPLYVSASGDETMLHLLWGDRVKVLQGGSRKKVNARGKTGYVDASDLGGDSLLEI